MFSHSPVHPSPATLETILNAVPNPVLLKDRSHRLVLVNDALCELLGHTRDELLGRVEEDLPDEQKKVFWKVDDEVFATGRPNENEEVITDGNGDLRVVVTHKRLLHLPTAEGDWPFILAVISDVTRFRDAERRARYLAEHDTLTGLANRAQLNDRLEATVRAAETSGERLAVLLLDLDGFKSVNDSHGHPIGDDLLRVVARRLAGVVRSVDTVARFGGDEFCIVQAPVRQPHGAFALAARIAAAVSQPVTIASIRVAVSASIGIALFPEDAKTPELLLQRADIALYSVKNSGRGGYRRYDGTTAVPDSPGWNIAADLRAALSADRLALAFQPLASAQDGTVRGFEALARWRHPIRGDIPPEIFIPAAEDAGLMPQVDAWALHRACAAAAHWPEHLQVCVNISASQLARGDLVAVVESALNAAAISGSRLELEVTETALVGNQDHLPAVFQRLRALGVRLALDDFGAGWASVATLQAYHFDRIKIDRSFVTNIASDAQSVAIVHAVLSIAQSLGLPVTAEGVEGLEQLVALRRMGCSELQGIYVGGPAEDAVIPDTRSIWSTISARTRPQAVED